MFMTGQDLSLLLKKKKRKKALGYSAQMTATDK